MPTAINEKVAVVLQLLGDDVAEEVLAHMGPERSAQLRASLEEARTRPLSPRMREEALAEFDRFYRFLLKSEHPGLRIAPGTGSDGNASDWETFEPGDDPVADLAKLTASQLSEVLQAEHPRTVALVLSRLPGEHTAKVLERLPEEQRNAVFVQLSRDERTAPELVELIAAAVVQRALTVSPQPQQEPDRIQKAVSVLRSLEKPRRGALMEAVEAEDQETAALLLEHLYTFDDLMTVETRTMQRLLSEIDSATLGTALCGADAKLVEKVMSNLSKRARESLQDEMDMQGHVSPQVIEQMRKEVVQILARLDQEDA